MKQVGIGFGAGSLSFNYKYDQFIFQKGREYRNQLGLPLFAMMGENESRRLYKGLDYLSGFIWFTPDFCL